MLKQTGNKLPPQSNLHDRLERPLKDLRLSVIDRCNFRCSYCMPASSPVGESLFSSRAQLLTVAELSRLVSAFKSLGVSKVRLTGGEPLLRPDFVDIVAALREVSGLRDLSMTTNGVLLPKMAPALKQAGLTRITVSLDSLDTDVFARMSGGRGNPSAVLDGISAACAAGFTQLKINCVVQKGVNDHTVMDLLEYFRGSGHIVRLIEFLDVGSSNGWRRDRVVPGAEWRRRIHTRWPLKPLPKSQDGETAERYAYLDGQGEIGLINSITQPFCGTCCRVRVTADGFLYGCLFSARGTPLLPLLRGNCDEAELSGFIRNFWLRRDDRYSEIRHLSPEKNRGQEMYRMGG
jgi:cyclic pyranopterin phosphate synthase